MAALGVGSAPSRATLAFAGLIVFVALVYANPGMLLFADAGDVGIAKAAAALALAALGGAWLLGDRPLWGGGLVGAAISGFFVCIAASSLWSLWPSMTLDTLADGLKYLAIFFLTANVIDAPARANRLVHALAWASTIPAAFTIDSWARGQHLVEGDRAAWIGVFGNPNDLAYHLAVGVALALAGRELAKSRALRLAYLVALATMATAIVLTQSRGGLIATGAVVGLWAIRGMRRGRALASGAALVVLAIYFAPSATWQRARTIEHYEDDASAEGRIDAWRTGYNVFADCPLTGVGAGAFMLAWPEYAPGDAGPPRSAHNTFVQVLAETGLPSLLLFMGALVACALGVSRAARRADLGTAARAVQVGLGAFAVSSLTGGLAYSWPLYLLLGLGAALIRVEQKSALVPSPLVALPEVR